MRKKESDNTRHAAGDRGALMPGGTERPLLACGAETKRRLIAQVEGAVARWRAEWGVPDASVGPATCHTPFEMPPGELFTPTRRWQPGSVGSWWTFQPPALPSTEVPSHLSALMRLLFGGAAEGGAIPAHSAKRTVAWRVTGDAWADWLSLWECDRPAGTPLPAEELPGDPEKHWRPWSGALLVTLPWAGGVLRVILSRERVVGFGDGQRRATTKESAVVSPWSAAARSRTHLQVGTRPFPIDLGALAGLRVGDVIQTAHPLDLPLEVRRSDATPGEGVVCTAAIGSVGRSRAALLLPASNPPEREFSEARQDQASQPVPPFRSIASTP